MTVPADWDIDWLGSVADVIDPHPSHRAPKIVHNGFPYVGIGDILESGDILSNQCRKVSERAIEEQENSYTIEDGSIGFGRVGTVGKVVWLKKQDFRYALSPTLAIVKPKKISSLYLYYALKSSIINKQINLLITGTTRHSLGILSLRKLRILSPPLPEQRKIAAILSSVDAAIQETDAIIAQTEQVKKGLMQELFTKGIGHNEFKETKFGVMPSIWRVVKLGDIVSKVQYGLSKTGNPEGKYPIIRMNNLSDGCIDISSLQYVELDEFEYKKYHLEKGDILFNRTNSSDLVGKTSLYNLDGGFVFASYIIRIVCKTEHVLPDYVNSYLNWGRSQDRLKGLATKGVSQSNINAKALKNFDVHLPPVSEQLQISEILSGVENRLCSERMHRDSLEMLKKGLMQDLLTGKVRVKVDAHA